MQINDFFLSSYSRFKNSSYIHEFTFILLSSLLRQSFISKECNLYYVCTAVFTLDAGLLAISQYPEGPATGHLDTGFFLGFPVSINKC